MIKDKPKILVVDDETFYIDILVELLSDDYRVLVAKNGEQALARIDNELPDLILLDWVMPGMSGIDVCLKLKSNKKTKQIPIVFLTVKSEIEDEIEGFKCGAIDYIRKPMSPPIVKARVKNHIELRLAQQLLNNHKERLESEVEKRLGELQRTKDVAIHCMASLAETRDPETGIHIKRTQNYIRLLANTLAKTKKYNDILNPEMINILWKSAPLHDIGKVGIADSILLKPAPLDNEGWKEMKKHSYYGKKAIESAEEQFGQGTSDFLQMAKEIAYSHHEKWDGTGYPQGLAGEEIPLSGRIMAVADVYDALISKRVYKEAFSHEKAVEIIKEGSGIHFDPDLISAFEKVTDEFSKIASEHQGEG